MRWNIEYRRRGHEKIDAFVRKVGLRWPMELSDLSPLDFFLWWYYDFDLLVNELRPSGDFNFSIGQVNKMFLENFLLDYFDKFFGLCLRN